MKRVELKNLFTKVVVGMAVISTALIAGSIGNAEEGDRRDQNFQKSENRSVLKSDSTIDNEILYNKQLLVGLLHPFRWSCPMKNSCVCVMSTQG